MGIFSLADILSGSTRDSSSFFPYPHCFWSGVELGSFIMVWLLGLFSIICSKKQIQRNSKKEKHDMIYQFHKLNRIFFLCNWLSFIPPRKTLSLNLSGYRLKYCFSGKPEYPPLTYPISFVSGFHVIRFHVVEFNFKCSGKYWDHWDVD